MVGFGDGGGGATDAAIARVAARAWIAPGDWFATLEPAALPAYTGELYLETHRGTYTTHRDIKARNAALERALAAVEEACAWCVAIRAPQSVIVPLTDDLRTAWTIVLRNQFHDVLAGSSTAAVYAEAHAEYDRAERIVERLRAGTQAVLPRTQLTRAEPQLAVPEAAGNDEFHFAGEYVRARVRADGTIVELGAAQGPSVLTLGNGLAAYVDTPAAWDAWNIDRGYVDKRVRVKPRGATIDEGGLVVRLQIGRRSSAAMRIELRADEPFLRVELAVDWHEDRVLLRVENRLAVAASAVRFGQPHGSHSAPRPGPQRGRTGALRGARSALCACRRRQSRPGHPGPRHLWLERARAQRRRRAAGDVAVAFAALARSGRRPGRAPHRVRVRADRRARPCAALEAAWRDYAENPARAAVHLRDAGGTRRCDQAGRRWPRHHRARARVRWRHAAGRGALRRPDAVGATGRRRRAARPR